MLKPDAFVRLQERSDGDDFEHTFYIELDRSTETLPILAAKARVYLDHYQHGGLAMRYGASADRYREFPFHVLMIVNTAERRNNLCEELLSMRPPVLSLTRIALAAEVTVDPLGPVWCTPADYERAASGTEFDVTSKKPSSRYGYRRQAERDDLIASRLARQSLLGEA